MSVQISLTTNKVPYYIEICYEAIVFSLNLIWFRHFVFDSNEKFEIDGYIEAGWFILSLLFLFILWQEFIIEILPNSMLNQIHINHIKIKKKKKNEEMFSLYDMYCSISMTRIFWFLWKRFVILKFLKIKVY